jgi:hypothetical protein
MVDLVRFGAMVQNKLPRINAAAGARRSYERSKNLRAKQKGPAWSGADPTHKRNEDCARVLMCQEKYRPGRKSSQYQI